MILPSVAQIETENNTRKLRRLIRKVTTTCILLGSACCILLLLSSSFIGVCLFHSPLASRYIFTLAWICPFLYTNTTFISILNAESVEKLAYPFSYHMFKILIRIARYPIDTSGIRNPRIPDWTTVKPDIYVLFLFHLSALSLQIQCEPKDSWAHIAFQENTDSIQN